MAIQLDLEHICTICLQECSDMSSIYENDEFKNSYAQKISTCYPELDEIQLEKKPKKICESCIRDCEAAYRFHKNCQTAVLVFRCTLKDEVDSSVVQIVEDVVEESLIEDETETETESTNTKTAADEQTEQTGQTEFLEFEHLKLNYDEEHLDDVSEAAYEDIIESDTDSNTVYNDVQNQEDISLSEEDTKETIQKQKLSNLMKKGKSKGNNGPKICEICGNNYKYQHALNSHMRRHLNVKPFHCEFCEKAFVSNVELRRHIRVHTGAKPYGCSYCERRFSDYGSRIKHERTHTGERPFVCQTCNKSFAYAHVLSVHLRTHTGEKKFQCTECGKGFTKKSYMLAHMEQHRRTAIIVSKNATDQSQDNSDLEKHLETHIVVEIHEENHINDQLKLNGKCITIKRK